ncbi:MAG: hypothetical protein NC394_10015 [Bacteroides sp.]|nr:hypothetical protein [Bacteroides sp.]
MDINKRKPIARAVLMLPLLSFLLASCAEKGLYESFSDIEGDGVFSETSEISAVPPYLSDLSEPSELSEVSAVFSENFYSKETGTSEKEEETSRVSPRSFSPCDLSDVPFDDIIPTEFSVFDGDAFPSGDKAAEAAAVAAYKSSELYTEALEQAKELCRYENGELVLAEDNWKTVYGGYGDYIDESAAPETELKAYVIDGVSAKFDGLTEENIFFLAAAAPDSYIISSGDSADFVFPVYVNAQGEAFLLECAGYQEAISVEFIRYGKTGKIHLISNGAHSEGTMLTSVYSFENGQPRVELCTHGAFVTVEGNGRTLRWDYSYAWSSFVFYSEELSRYCGIKDAPISEAAAEMICSDEDMLEYEPNIREAYENGRLSVLGGKYILVGSSSYEYDGTGFIPTYPYRTFIPVMPDREGKSVSEEDIFYTAIDGQGTK